MKFRPTLASLHCQNHRHCRAVCWAYFDILISILSNYVAYRPTCEAVTGLLQCTVNIDVQTAATEGVVFLL